MNEGETKMGEQLKQVDTLPYFEKCLPVTLPFTFSQVWNQQVKGLATSAFAYFSSFQFGLSVKTGEVSN